MVAPTGCSNSSLARQRCSKVHGGTFGCSKSSLASLARYVLVELRAQQALGEVHVLVHFVPDSLALLLLTLVVVADVDARDRIDEGFVPVVGEES